MRKRRRPHGRRLNILPKTAHTPLMKKRATFLCVLAVFVILFACAFKLDENSSIKDLTHPYINTYECTRATLGETDLLEEYEYFRIIVGENNDLKVLFKRKDGKAYEFSSKYTFDDTTHELTAEIGVLGYTYKQKTIIEKGRFTISMPILNKQLIMIFETN